MTRILFVCTGNTCRSPMAESMLVRMAGERGLAWIDVKSAGVAAAEGVPVSKHAAKVLGSKSCSCDNRSKPLTASLVNWADLILTMSSEHKRHVIQRFPEAMEKTETLKEYVHGADEGAQAKIMEMESLLTDLQLKAALAQPVTEEERTRLLTLERELPNPNIADPYGGTLEVYERCASEIEQCLIRLLDRLQEDASSQY